MKKLFQDFIGILYPETCPGCGQVFVAGENTLCFACEMNLPVFKNEQVVENILGGRIPLQKAAIFLKFYAGGITQRLLHEVKYRNNRNMGNHLGRLFMKSYNGKSEFHFIDLIIPVPLHEEKQKSRGYNQSELIANGISAEINRPVATHIIQRVKESSTQTRKSREERWLNVDGIFASDGESLQGKNILLVDDVITTGATMEACAQSALDKGAGSVSFAVLATAM